ncbi:MAG: YafY family protein [Pseudomonadota bacterium]
MVDLLRGGHLTTAERLSEQLEVSVRTIYRDMADLISSGVPIDGEAGVGYVMRPGYDVPPLMFNRSEVSALVAGARLIEAWGGAGMARSASDALQKIAAVIPKEVAAETQSVAVQAFKSPELLQSQRELIDVLDDAIHAKMGLKLVYVDEANRLTKRQVRPLGLVFWGKVWTLIAWCDLRNNFRLFRIDRMSDVKSTNKFELEAHQTLAVFYEREADCAG